MARLNDDNTLEDMLGAIYVVLLSPTSEISLEKTLNEIIQRIELKIADNRNRTRHNWFSHALEFAKQAKVRYLAGEFELGEELLRKVEEYLVSGNKAYRRKATLFIAPDGEINPTVSKETNPPNPHP